MSTNQPKTSNVQKLAESAVMVVLFIVLNEFTPFKLPFGGSVTLFSQLPLLIIAYRYGIQWGLLSALSASLVNALLGASSFSYVVGVPAFLTVLFADYVVAFGCFGLGGIFRKVIKNQGLALSAGAVLASTIRFISHFISGVTIWKGYAAEGQTAAAYSFSYNISYMLPELIITVLGALAVSTVLDFTQPNILRKRNK